MSIYSGLLQTSLENRKIFENFLTGMSPGELFRIPEGHNNNIIWHIGHIISVQQQLVYGLSNLPLKVSKEFAKNYGRGSMPASDINEAAIKEISSLLFTTIENTREDLENDIFKNFTPYKTLPGIELNNVKDAMEFNNFHDKIHLKRVFTLKEAVSS